MFPFRVVHSTVRRAAPEQTTKSLPPSSPESVISEADESIVGTGRLKTTSVTDSQRSALLVEIDQPAAHPNREVIRVLTQDGLQNTTPPMDIGCI